jgi:tetratricopeptide (TPR) repeat protein
MSQHEGEPSQAESQPQPTRLQQWFAGLPLPDLAIMLGLLVSIAAVYAQVGQFDFINFDDGYYVYHNENVLAGLTLQSIRSAFTDLVSSNWQPVTMLSHTLDAQLFGAQSGMPHLVNVLFHAISSVLLFVLLKRATHERWPSAFVAAIFALHPLHVESVAWISERKDVLSTFFLFLALYAYVRYAEHPNVRSYLIVCGLFVLGLMSKPMLVTFPFILLLFDVWPLRRVQLPKIFWEKLPFFALSAISSVVAYRVQRATGAVAEAIPYAGRIAKSLLSYITYIRQTFWPARLAVFYPYPRFILASRAGMALLILLAVSAAAVVAWRKRPYLATGWFWYLGTLVPVIGLVKIGEQSHADRYTYIPMVGLLMMLSWGAADVVTMWPGTKSAIAAVAAACCVACLGLTWQQVGYWSNSETIYLHALDVTDDNWLAHGNLGAYLMKIPERRADAMQHLEAALHIKPDYGQAENNLGLCMAGIELCGAAIPHFEAALRDIPGLFEARNNLGHCLSITGNYGPAIVQLEAVLRVRPDYPEAHFNLGMTLAKIPGRELEAVAEFQTGLRRSPGNGEAHRQLGELLVRLGRTQEAISHFESAQRIQRSAETSSVLDRLGAGGR